MWACIHIWSVSIEIHSVSLLLTYKYPCLSVGLCPVHGVGTRAIQLHLHHSVSMCVYALGTHSCVYPCSEHCIHTFIHHAFLIQVMGNMNISSTLAFSLHMFCEEQQWSQPEAKLGLLCLLGAALDFPLCFRKFWKFSSSPVWCLKHRKFTPFSFCLF